MSSASIDARRGVRAPVEEDRVAIPSVPRSRHRWAVMLAGGDGTRLQSLTLKIAGDLRPKQFCSIFGDESLLAQTRARLQSLFHVDRELFVVTRAHETYYREALRNVDDSRIIAQPLNRGTGVAVVLALLHIMQRDADARLHSLSGDGLCLDVKRLAAKIFPCVRVERRWRFGTQQARPHYVRRDFDRRIA